MAVAPVIRPFLRLGTFTVPNTGDWQAYTWVPLKDTGGNLVKFTGGSVQTLRATTDNGGYNVNFYELVSTNTSVGVVTLAASVSGGNINLSFPTQVGLTVTKLEYKNNLSDIGWIPVGDLISGNGAVQSVSDTPGGNTRYYHARIQ